MTLYRATIIDTPGNPFAGDPADAIAADADGGVLVRDGMIVARGPFAALHAEHPEEPVTELPGGLLLPGFVDTHVHYPQIRAIGGLGMPLLDWLERCALPEESRLADPTYAGMVAKEFLDGLLACGTTTALVFGSHFAPAMDLLFTEAEIRGLNVTAGLVLSDRILRADLLSTPDRALAESRELIQRWHGKGRLRFAVTPRFSLSASEEILSVCTDLVQDAAGGRKDIWFTSHLNENVSEISAVAAPVPRVGSLPRHLPPARTGQRAAASLRTTCMPATRNWR